MQDKFEFLDDNRCIKRKFRIIRSIAKANMALLSPSVNVLLGCDCMIICASSMKPVYSF